MAHSFLRAAEDELSCPICLELFVEPNIPKDLPGCDHIICEVCLKEMVKDLRGEHQTIKCPECRQDMVLPENGVDALKTNRRIRNLAEKHPKDVKELSSSGESVKPKVPLCPHHDDEKMHYYCTSCNALACQACLILNHKGPNHNIVGVKDRYAVQKGEMQNILTETKAKIIKCKETLNELKALQDQVQTSQSKEEQKIDRHVEACMNEILERAQALKAELQTTGREKQRKINNLADGIEQQIKEAETDHVAASNCLANASEYEYIAQHISLSDKLKKINIDSPSNAFSKEAAAVFKEENCKIKLGILVCETHARRCAKRPISLILIQTLAELRHVRRITWSSDGSLLAVNRERGTKMTNVITYCKEHPNHYCRQQCWQFATNYTPGDISVLADGNILIALWENIEAYSSIGKYLKKIYTSRNGLMCLNISACGKIIIGDMSSDLKELDYAGNITRTVKSKINPLHVVFIKYPLIAVSNDSDKVSVLNVHSGKETLSIDVPGVRGICYDEPTESLLVIAKSGKCIEQYCCNTGRLVASLTEGLDNAINLALSTDRILAVSEKTCVKLYQLCDKLF